MEQTLSQRSEFLTWPFAQRSVAGCLTINSCQISLVEFCLMFVVLGLGEMGEKSTIVFLLVARSLPEISERTGYQ